MTGPRLRFKGGKRGRGVDVRDARERPTLTSPYRRGGFSKIN